MASKRKNTYSKKTKTLMVYETDSEDTPNRSSRDDVYNESESETQTTDVNSSYVVSDSSDELPNLWPANETVHLCSCPNGEVNKHNNHAPAVTGIDNLFVALFWFAINIALGIFLFLKNLITTDWIKYYFVKSHFLQECHNKCCFCLHKGNMIHQSCKTKCECVHDLHKNSAVPFGSVFPEIVGKKQLSQMIKENRRERRKPPENFVPLESSETPFTDKHPRRGRERMSEASKKQCSQQSCTKMYKDESTQTIDKFTVFQNLGHNVPPSSLKQKWCSFHLPVKSDVPSQSSDYRMKVNESSCSSDLSDGSMQYTGKAAKYHQKSNKCSCTKQRKSVIIHAFESEESSNDTSIKNGRQTNGVCNTRKSLKMISCSSRGPESTVSDRPTTNESKSGLEPVVLKNLQESLDQLLNAIQMSVQNKQVHSQSISACANVRENFSVANIENISHSCSQNPVTSSNLQESIDRFSSVVQTFAQNNEIYTKIIRDGQNSSHARQSNTDSFPSNTIETTTCSSKNKYIIGQGDFDSCKLNPKAMANNSNTLVPPRNSSNFTENHLDNFQNKLLTNTFLKHTQNPAMQTDELPKDSHMIRNNLKNSNPEKVTVEQARPNTIDVLLEVMKGAPNKSIDDIMIRPVQTAKASNESDIIVTHKRNRKIIDGPAENTPSLVVDTIKSNQCEITDKQQKDSEKTINDADMSIETNIKSDESVRCTPGHYKSAESALNVLIDMMKNNPNKNVLNLMKPPAPDRLRLSNRIDFVTPYKKINPDNGKFNSNVDIKKTDTCASAKVGKFLGQRPEHEMNENNTVRPQHKKSRHSKNSLNRTSSLHTIPNLIRTVEINDKKDEEQKSEKFRPTLSVVIEEDEDDSNILQKFKCTRCNITTAKHEEKLSSYENSNEKFMKEYFSKIMDKDKVHVENIQVTKNVCFDVIVESKNVPVECSDEMKDLNTKTGYTGNKLQLTNKELALSSTESEKNSENCEIKFEQPQKKIMLDTGNTALVISKDSPLTINCIPPSSAINENINYNNDNTDENLIYDSNKNSNNQVISQEHDKEDVSEWNVCEPTEDFNSHRLYSNSASPESDIICCNPQLAWPSQVKQLTDYYNSYSKTHSEKPIGYQSSHGAISGHKIKYTIYSKSNANEFENGCTNSVTENVVQECDSIAADINCKNNGSMIISEHQKKSAKHELDISNRVLAEEEEFTVKFQQNDDVSCFPVDVPSNTENMACCFINTSLVETVSEEQASVTYERTNAVDEDSKHNYITSREATQREDHINKKQSSESVPDRLETMYNEENFESVPEVYEPVSTDNFISRSTSGMHDPEHDEEKMKNSAAAEYTVDEDVSVNDDFSGLHDTRCQEDQRWQDKFYHKETSEQLLFARNVNIVEVCNEKECNEDNLISENKENVDEERFHMLNVKPAYQTHGTMKEVDFTNADKVFAMTKNYVNSENLETNIFNRESPSDSEEEMHMISSKKWQHNKEMETDISIESSGKAEEESFIIDSQEDLYNKDTSKIICSGSSDEASLNDNSVSGYVEPVFTYKASQLYINQLIQSRQVHDAEGLSGDSVNLKTIEMNEKFSVEDYSSKNLSDDPTEKGTSLHFQGKHFETVSKLQDGALSDQSNTHCSKGSISDTTDKKLPSKTSKVNDKNVLGYTEPMFTYKASQLYINRLIQSRRVCDADLSGDPVDLETVEPCKNSNDVTFNKKLTAKESLSASDKDFTYTAMIDKEPQSTSSQIDPRKYAGQYKNNSNISHFRDPDEGCSDSYCLDCINLQQSQINESVAGYKESIAQISNAYLTNIFHYKMQYHNADYKPPEELKPKRMSRRQLRKSIINSLSVHIQIDFSDVKHLLKYKDTQVHGIPKKEDENMYYKQKKIRSKIGRRSLCSQTSVNNLSKSQHSKLSKSKANILRIPSRVSSSKISQHTFPFKLGLPPQGAKLLQRSPSICRPARHNIRQCKVPSKTALSIQNRDKYSDAGNCLFYTQSSVDCSLSDSINAQITGDPYPELNYRFAPVKAERDDPCDGEIIPSDTESDEKFPVKPARRIIKRYSSKINSLVYEEENLRPEMLLPKRASSVHNIVLGISVTGRKLPMQSNKCSMLLENESVHRLVTGASEKDHLLWRYSKTDMLLGTPSEYNMITGVKKVLSKESSRPALLTKTSSKHLLPPDTIS